MLITSWNPTDCQWLFFKVIGCTYPPWRALFQRIVDLLSRPIQAKTHLTEVSFLIFSHTLDLLRFAFNGDCQDSKVELRQLRDSRAAGALPTDCRNFMCFREYGTCFREVGCYQRHPGSGGARICIWGQAPAKPRRYNALAHYQLTDGPSTESLAILLDPRSCFLVHH
jgi:hypothetical protein